jgi:hypothetical protein
MSRRPPHTSLLARVTTVSNALGLDTLKQRQWAIFKTSAIKGVGTLSPSSPYAAACRSARGDEAYNQATNLPLTFIFLSALLRSARRPGLVRIPQSGLPTLLAFGHSHFVCARTSHQARERHQRGQVGRLVGPPTRPFVPPPQPSLLSKFCSSFTLKFNAAWTAMQTHLPTPQLFVYFFIYLVNDKCFSSLSLSLCFPSSLEAPPL